MGNDKRRTVIINVLCILGALAVTLPLLILGHYNYPSADDWSFGARTHHVVEAGGNVLEVVREAFHVAVEWRDKTEPRYANAFLGALQPGIWGEHCYRITAWIMIGSLYVSELVLCWYLLKDAGEARRKWILPIMIPSLLIQLLCVPYPVETFYWYTGAINYTFIFSLSLILLTIFLRLKEGNMSTAKTTLLIIAGCILAVFVGGDSYAASLSAVCVFGALSLLMLWKDRKALARTLPITVVTTVGLLVCLIAPANQARLENEFEGTTTGAFYAIYASLTRTGLNIFSWTTLKIIAMVLLIAPFLWMVLKEVRYTFRYPALFTAFTYGIYASQIVATMYVDGSTGGGRMADVLYYAYHIWVLLNVGYWLGWLQRKQLLERLTVFGKYKSSVRQHLLAWFVCVGAALILILGVTEIRQSSTYKALAWLGKGYAVEYAQIWEERLDVLKDDSIQEVYFEAIPANGEMIFYADFEPGENYINNACEIYYGKEHISIK